MSTTPRLQLTGVLIHDERTGTVAAYFAELPNIIAEGETEDEAKANLVDALGFMFEVERDEAMENKGFNRGTTQVYNVELSPA